MAICWCDVMSGRACRAVILLTEKVVLPIHSQRFWQRSPVTHMNTLPLLFCLKSLLGAQRECRNICWVGEGQRKSAMLKFRIGDGPGALVKHSRGHRTIKPMYDIYEKLYVSHMTYRMFPYIMSRDLHNFFRWKILTWLPLPVGSWARTSSRYHFVARGANFACGGLFLCWDLQFSTPVAYRWLSRINGYLGLFCRFLKFVVDSSRFIWFV